MRNYINNLETRHIELHFEKSEYLALSEAQKTELKGAYLWSKSAGAWVSRSTSNHYWAIEVAKKLGFTEEERQGERLSYAEQLAVKVEKAEHRVERMEEHAANAVKRAESLQAGLNSMHGDIAFFTQPNINSSRGRAFTNYRNKLYARYESGMKEYRRSEYFQDRAATAQETADMKQLKNPVYLHNRIKECNSNIKKLQANIVAYEDKIFRIGNGEVITSYVTKEPITVERLEECIQQNLEKMEWEMDKLAFMENCMDEIGGNKFSKDNVKVGYIVGMKRWGRCEILSAGPVNVTFKILDGGAAGGVLTDPYAAIVEIIEAKEATQGIKNPYKAGNILCAHRPADDSIYKAYQVIKATATGVRLQQIAVEKGIPIPDKFISDKQTQRKITKSKYSDFVGVYENDWQLHKYEA